MWRRSKESADLAALAVLYVCEREYYQWLEAVLAPAGDNAFARVIGRAIMEQKTKDQLTGIIVEDRASH